MPEWSIGAVSKTVERFAFQGFESLSLRKIIGITKCLSQSYTDFISPIYQKIYRFPEAFGLNPFCSLSPHASKPQNNPFSLQLLLSFLWNNPRQLGFFVFLWQLLKHNMKRIVTIFAFTAIITLLNSCKKKEVHVVMETTKGNIELKLYDATPLHRDNFKMLVEEGAYDSLLFHRVIRDFMIQGGDPDSKHAESGVLLGEGDRPYTIPAEFRLDEGIFHRRGVLAAAREGDDVNPEQRSSAMQFYIVWGRTFDDESLDKVQKRIDSYTNGRVKLTPEMREVYKTIGGTPHLDGQYTVFGEVVSGLDVVDFIQQVATDTNDRPVEDVRIIRAYLR